MSRAIRRQQRGRDVSPLMKRGRGDTAIRVPELFVRAALPNLSEPKALEKAHHLARLEHWRLGHRSTDLYRLNADELSLESGISVL